MKKSLSLAPNMTDVIIELEEEHNLVGCTTHSEFNRADTVGDWLSPDYRMVEDIDPDIIFTSDPLQREIRDELEDMGYNVVHTEPERFSDLLDMIELVGEKLNVQNKADDLVKETVSRYHKIKELDEIKNETVYCEEWDSPPMAAGNWVPDMIDIVGASYPFVEKGSRSKSVNENEFSNYNLDYFISHICGQGQMDYFRPVRENWDYEGDVYFINDKYMNRLSTNTIVGLEILAEIMHNKRMGHSDKYNVLSFDEAIGSE